MRKKNGKKPKAAKGASGVTNGTPTATTASPESPTPAVVKFKTNDGQVREVYSAYVRIHGAAEPIECGETSQTVDSWIDYVANHNLQVDDTNDYLLRANWAFIPIARFHAAYGVYDESRSNLLEAVSLLLADDVVSPFVAFGVGAHLDDVDLCALAVSHSSEVVSDSNTPNHNHTHPASSSNDQDAGVGFCFWFNYRNQEKPDPLPHVPHARPGGTLDPRQFALIQWDLLPKNYIWLLVQARQCPSQGVEIGEALTTIWNSMMPNGRAPNFSRTVF